MTNQTSAEPRVLENDDELGLARRFSGVRRLYGEAGVTRFEQAHVCVIGMGGVGSWAVEALARNGIGRLTLIDLDSIALSNVNRQLHALEDEFGKAKVTTMAQRIHGINAACQVREIEDFITPDNLDEILAEPFDAILDAIDDAPAKVALAAFCRQRKIPLIMAGGAGGRIDPTRIRHGDLARSSGDRLLAKVRNSLRRGHNFPRGDKVKFGIACVYSDEPLRKPLAYSCDVEDDTLTGLNCSGYGSSVCVTAPFGFAAASLVLNLLLET
jgi:tRNA A37 threonylcarbamoyladenosine dehydratase